MKCRTSIRSMRSSSWLWVVATGLAAFTLAGCPQPPVVTPPDAPLPPGIAPGLTITVVSVSIPDDLRPEVIFELTDAKGNRIPLAELTEARFILDYLDDAGPGDTRHYVSYTTAIEDPDRTPNSGDEAVQATYDAARLTGISRNSDGTFTYKFASALPATYDPNRSHQLAGQFRRSFLVDGKVYPFNLEYAFVPADASATPETREIVAIESCNNCHTRLSVHGDIRRDVQLCIMCHTPQSSDAQSGNSVDFATMIHKIHRGAELPSVQAGEPYQIIGFGGSVNDYSDVEFPQDIRNCAVCHTGAPQSDYHLTKPTLNGCSSCHDRTWFGEPDAMPATFEMHTGGQQVDNSLCAICHKPNGPAPAPITEAHTVPTDSAAAPGLALNILDVQTTAVEGGNQLQITFEALDKTGNRYGELSSLASCGLIVAYPAPEYETVIRETVTGRPAGVIVANANKTFTYTFAALLPDTDATFAVSMEGRVSFTYRDVSYQQGTAPNAVVNFTVTGEAPEARRVVVSDAKCNVCHDEVRGHGGQRVGVGTCLLCHNVNATDAARRPAEAMPPETINFKDMIHRIHSGENLEGDYTVYGFGNVAHDFTEILFPGLRQQCSICHVDGSVELPLAEETLPTTVASNGEVVDQIFPNRAACTSCHDGILPNVHAVLQTDPASGIESCAVCHEQGAIAAVNAVHALAP